MWPNESDAPYGFGTSDYQVNEHYPDDDQVDDDQVDDDQVDDEPDVDDEPWPPQPMYGVMNTLNFYDDWPGSDPF